MDTPQELFRSIFNLAATKSNRHGKNDGIVACLDQLATGHPNLKTDPRAPTLYTAVLMALTPEEIIQAFTAAAKEEWFPSPGRLVALSGRADAVEAEALVALRTLAEALNLWPMLKPKRGQLLNEGRDGEGGPYLPEPERQYAADVPPPALAEPILRTIELLGDGDRTSGLQRITPAIAGILGTLGDEQAFEQRQAANVKRAFVDNYRRVRG